MNWESQTHLPFVCFNLVRVFGLFWVQDLSWSLSFLLCHIRVFPLRENIPECFECSLSATCLLLRVVLGVLQEARAQHIVGGPGYFRHSPFFDKCL